MTTGYGYPVAGSGAAQLRAADADRDRVSETLAGAYSEGRLSPEEYDDRLRLALSAQTYAELDRLVADLPGARPLAVIPVTQTNGLAVASLACGLGQFVLGPLATIPAIVLGHVARRQIRRTGEQGAGLALAGLLLGWVTVILGVIAVAVVVVAFAHLSSTAPALKP
jgi:hypothetical protein